MTCRRCCGMMVTDRFLDELGRAGSMIWRCVACGEIIDPVILINRMRWPQVKKKLYLRRIIYRPVRTVS